MKFYKIITGYNVDDFLPIDETELEKAIYCHIRGANGIFNNGTVSGKNIMMIREDWHKAMGWNYGYRLTADDYADPALKRVQAEYKGYFAEIKDKVNRLIETGQTNLISKNNLIKNNHE